MITNYTPLELWSIALRIARTHASVSSNFDGCMIAAIASLICDPMTDQNRDLLNQYNNAKLAHRVHCEAVEAVVARDERNGRHTP